MRTATTEAPAPNMPIGTITVGKTVYNVLRFPMGKEMERAGVQYNWGLQGPRGALYYVVDHGPKYKLNQVNINGKSVIRGLTREHFAEFMEGGADAK